MRKSNYTPVTAEPGLFSEVVNTFRKKMHCTLVLSSTTKLLSEGKLILYAQKQLRREKFCSDSGQLRKLSANDMRLQK